MWVMGCGAVWGNGNLHWHHQFISVSAPNVHNTIIEQSYRGTHQQWHHHNGNGRHACISSCFIVSTSRHRRHHYILMGSSSGNRHVISSRHRMVTLPKNGLIASIRSPSTPSPEYQASSSARVTPTWKQWCRKTSRAVCGYLIDIHQ